MKALSPLLSCYSIVYIVISSVKPDNSNLVKIYESTIPLGHEEPALSGLQLVESERKLEHLTDLSICGRFDFNTLNGANSRFMLIQVSTDPALIMS